MSNTPWLCTETLKRRLNSSDGSSSSGGGAKAVWVPTGTPTHRNLLWPFKITPARLFDLFSLSLGTLMQRDAGQRERERERERESRPGERDNVNADHIALQALAFTHQHLLEETHKHTHTHTHTHNGVDRIPNKALPFQPSDLIHYLSRLILIHHSGLSTANPLNVTQHGHTFQYSKCTQ